MKKKIKKLLKDEPKVKASYIAKKLGCEKQEVNSILYKFTEEFSVDLEFRWTLFCPGELKIVFDKNKWIDCNAFESTLESVSSEIEMATSVLFVLPENCKFLLESIARLLAICNQLAERGKKIKIDLSASLEALHYLNRVGFFDSLHAEIEVLPKKPKASTAKSFKGNNKNMVEFGAVDIVKGNKKLANLLTNTFIELSDEKYEDAVFTIFAELIGNIKEHSESPQHGFAALQKYGKPKSHIQTVVSDNGQGIVTTLRPSLKKNYPALYKLYSNDDVALLKKVMSEGNISRYGSSEGRGQGFKSSKEKALKFNARYSVRQEDFSLDFQFRNGRLLPIKERTGLVKISGTHICFDFYID